MSKFNCKRLKGRECILSVALLIFQLERIYTSEIVGGLKNPINYTATVGSQCSYNRNACPVVMEGYVLQMVRSILVLNKELLYERFFCVNWKKCSWWHFSKGNGRQSQWQNNI